MSGEHPAQGSPQYRQARQAWPSGYPNSHDPHRRPRWLSALSGCVTSIPIVVAMAGGQISASEGSRILRDVWTCTPKTVQRAMNEVPEVEVVGRGRNARWQFSNDINAVRVEEQWIVEMAQRDGMRTTVLRILAAQHTDIPISVVPDGPLQPPILTSRQARAVVAEQRTERTIRKLVRQVEVNGRRRSESSWQKVVRMIPEQYE